MHLELGFRVVQSVAEGLVELPQAVADGLGVDREAGGDLARVVSALQPAQQGLGQAFALGRSDRLQRQQVAFGQGLDERLVAEEQEGGEVVGAVHDAGRGQDAAAAELPGVARPPQRVGALGQRDGRGVVGATALASPAPKPAAAADDGARIVATQQVGARTVDLSIVSPAVGATVPVRIVLPTHFDTEPDRSWPVLYLLHGAHDDHTSWTRETDVASFLADQDVITVMPSSGPTGIPTDWRGLGGLHTPDYETFQITEVMQLLRRNYRANGTRAVAGVSTGGYGAMALAARHPGTFGAAASYSGILDTTALGMPTVLNAIVLRELSPPLMLWGSPRHEAENWRRHNPYDRAPGLTGTRLYVSQGSGLPGGDFGNLEGAVLEGTLWSQAHRFTRELERLGIPAQTHLYQGGTHGWSSWRAEFTASWPAGQLPAQRRCTGTTARQAVARRRSPSSEDVLRSASSWTSRESSDATVSPDSAGWRSTLPATISYVLVRPSRVWER